MNNFQIRDEIKKILSDQTVEVIEEMDQKVFQEISVLIQMSNANRIMMEIPGEFLEIMANDLKEGMDDE